MSDTTWHKISSVLYTEHSGLLCALCQCLLPWINGQMMVRKKCQGSSASEWADRLSRIWSWLRCLREGNWTPGCWSGSILYPSKPGSASVIFLPHHITKCLIVFKSSVLFIYITILKEKLKLLANMNIVLLSFRHLMSPVFLGSWVLPLLEGRFEDLETVKTYPRKNKDFLPF